MWKRPKRFSLVERTLSFSFAADRVRIGDVVDARANRYAGRTFIIRGSDLDKLRIVFSRVSFV
jgi:hypothetical protein